LGNFSDLLFWFFLLVFDIPNRDFIVIVENRRKLLKNL